MGARVCTGSVSWVTGGVGGGRVVLWVDDLVDDLLDFVHVD